MKLQTRCAVTEKIGIEAALQWRLVEIDAGRRADLEEMPRMISAWAASP